jgi:hypothetical protein
MECHSEKLRDEESGFALVALRAVNEKSAIMDALSKVDVTQGKEI